MSTARNSRLWYRTEMTLVLLAVPLVLIALLGSLFGGELLGRILITMFINLALVLGLQMFMGNSGVASFGHISFMAIGAFASVILTMTTRAKSLALPDLYPVLVDLHVPFLPALLLGGAAAAVVAAAIGYPLMRLSGAAAVVCTFAWLIITHVVLINWDEITNGPRTIFGIQRYTTLWTSALWGILFILVAFWFKESKVGLMLRSSREDARAAASIGVNIPLMRWIAFVLSAFVTGIAGGLWAHFIISFSTQAFYLSQTFFVIAILIIGGTESVSGAVVGTVIVTSIYEGLRSIEVAVNLADVFPFQLVGFTEVLLAVAMIVILILRPAGITSNQEIHLPGARRAERSEGEG